MSDDTIEKIKKNISRKVAEINVKTSNMLETNKIRIYISRLQDMVEDLQREIGEKAYEMWADGEMDAEALTGYFEQIKTKEEHIKKQKLKLMEMEKEEAQIFGKYRAEEDTEKKAGDKAEDKPVEKPEKTEDKIVCECPDCGELFTRYVHYCSNCGQRLD